MGLLGEFACDFFEAVGVAVHFAVGGFVEGAEEFADGFVDGVGVGGFFADDDGVEECEDAVGLLLDAVDAEGGEGGVVGDGVEGFDGDVAGAFEGVEGGEGGFGGGCGSGCGGGECGVVAEFDGFAGGDDCSAGATGGGEGFEDQEVAHGLFVGLFDGVSVCAAGGAAGELAEGVFHADDLSGGPLVGVEEGFFAVGPVAVLVDVGVGEVVHLEDGDGVTGFDEFVVDGEVAGATAVGTFDEGVGVEEAGGGEEFGVVGGVGCAGGFALLFGPAFGGVGFEVFAGGSVAGGAGVAFVEGELFALEGFGCVGGVAGEAVCGGGGVGDAGCGGDFFGFVVGEYVEGGAVGVFAGPEGVGVLAVG